MSGVRVYIITERVRGEVCKVGISANPDSRVFALNAGNARELYVAAVTRPFSRTEALEIESAAHHDLEHWALGREWFHCPLEYALDALRGVCGEAEIEYVA